jgi:hypothetical protein
MKRFIVILMMTALFGAMNVTANAGTTTLSKSPDASTIETCSIVMAIGSMILDMKRSGSSLQDVKKKCNSIHTENASKPLIVATCTLLSDRIYVDHEFSGKSGEIAIFYECLEIITEDKQKSQKKTAI